MKRDDKRWLTIPIYVDVDTGEILGHKMPKNYKKTETIKKEYSEDEKFRIITSTIGCREHGEQLQINFGEYRIE